MAVSATGCCVIGVVTLRVTENNKESKDTRACKVFEEEIVKI